MCLCLFACLEAFGGKIKASKLWSVTHIWIFLFVSQGCYATTFLVKRENLLAQFITTLFLMVGWSQLHLNINHKNQIHALFGDTSHFVCVIREVSYTGEGKVFRKIINSAISRLFCSQRVALAQSQPYLRVRTKRFLRKSI